MAYLLEQEPEQDFGECLRMELGWSEVAKGLSKVLMGYAVLLLGSMIGGGLLGLAVVNLAKGGLNGNQINIGALWQLYLGMGIISVTCLISFGIIVAGQFKCALYASERHGARWFMFLCMACLLLGPTFQMASGIASWQTLSEVKDNPVKIQEMHFNRLGQRLQLIGFGLSLLYPLCFTLFLRAVGICLHASKHVAVINAYLVFGGALAAATIFVLYKLPHGAAPVHVAAPIVLAPVILGLFAGWAVMSVGYIALIAAMRICILSTVATVRSPLEVNTRAPYMSHV